VNSTARPWPEASSRMTAFLSAAVTLSRWCDIAGTEAAAESTEWVSGSVR
jgi:hypothetical protein